MPAAPAPDERARVIALLNPAPVSIDDLIRLSGTSPRIVLTLDQLIGLKPRHFEDVAQSVEPIAPGDLGKLLRQ